MSGDDARRRVVGNVYELPAPGKLQVVGVGYLHECEPCGVSAADAASLISAPGIPDLRGGTTLAGVRLTPARNAAPLPNCRRFGNEHIPPASGMVVS